jgi:steroid 5-alpha reductase family enzyme
MSQFVSLPILAFAAVSIVMILVWLWAIKINNAGVVDIFWSFNFPIIAIIYYLMGEGFDQRRLIVLIMVCVWGARLGGYLFVRVLGHIKEEDGRYKQLRVDWAPNANTKFFWFFQMQAFSNVFLSIPFLVACVNPAPELSVLEQIGAGLWLVSISGEALADRQLQVFKKNATNKGKVCDVGLWHYSRHPNYFFEWMIWVSYFIFACASPYGWIAIICPLSILYLLFKVTGIPMTEDQAIRSKGEAYKEYQRTTSAFVPWFKNR